MALIDRTQQVDVAILDVGPDEHGMTTRDPERGVVMVAAARTRNPMRQRSTLAHELAHVLFADYEAPRSEGWGARDREEVRADAFARHLLVPLDALRHGHFIPQQPVVEVAVLSDLVQQFQASPQIVAIQLAEAGLIGADLKREWMAWSAPRLAARYGWTDQYQVWQQESDTRRAPQRLLARAVTGYLTGVVSLHYVARLRGAEVEAVAAEFAEQGLLPGLPEPVADIDLAELAPPEIARPAVDFGDLEEPDNTDDRGDSDA
ncbi:ImmA/IrrE family metallo-endopeptidase [Georgenia yuyongxinii]